MLSFREFRPDDLAALEIQHQQSLEMMGVADWGAMGVAAAERGPAWTGTIGGRPVGCAGFALMWPGRAAAWCLLACGIPRMAWPAVHRAVKSRMAQLPALGIHRVECEVAHGFLAGHRWVRMLGFDHEGVMRAYGPDGRDFHRYAKVFT